MAVITSRHPGLRPETIRTRIARFMPSRAATGWTVVWSSGVDYADEILDEYELRTAEHLGCYGNAVAHALAQSDLAPKRLRLSAEATSGDGGTPVVTIEVRAHITGPEIDQTMFDAIIQRAEPRCPVLKGLATEATLRVVAILDHALAAQPVVPVSHRPALHRPRPRPPRGQRVAPTSQARRRPRRATPARVTPPLPRPRRARWLPRRER